MDFHMVDMLIVGLILFLAIRGLLNGFSKELFNFIALVGGVAVAARMNTIVSELINEQQIIPQMNVDFQKFIGFAVILLLFYVVFSVLSSIFNKFSSENPSLISRLLGYIVGVARNIFIFSAIIFGISKADFLKEKLSPHYEGSQLFVPMTEIGAQLLNMNKNTQTTTNKEDNQSNINNDINDTENNVSLF